MADPNLSASTLRPGAVSAESGDVRMAQAIEDYFAHFDPASAKQRSPIPLVTEEGVPFEDVMPGRRAPGVPPETRSSQQIEANYQAQRRREQDRLQALEKAEGNWVSSMEREEDYRRRDIAKAELVGVINAIKYGSSGPQLEPNADPFPAAHGWFGESFAPYERGRVPTWGEISDPATQAKANRYFDAAASLGLTWTKPQVRQFYEDLVEPERREHPGPVGLLGDLAGQVGENEVDRINRMAQPYYPR